jgi:hypothetical protein
VVERDQEWVPARPGNRYMLHVADVDARMEQLAKRAEDLPSSTLAIFVDYLTYHAHMASRILSEQSSYNDTSFAVRFKGRHEGIVAVAIELGNILESRRIGREEAEKRMAMQRSGDE